MFLRKIFLGCKMFTYHHGREGIDTPFKVDGQRIRRSRKSVWNKLGDWDLYLHTGNGTPLQYSCLENPMDRGAWWAAVYEVAKSWTWLSNFTFPFHFHALEKEMATHSSVLALRIPGKGEPGGLPSMGSHRVRHDWSDFAAAYTK